ncbi:MAG: J domain-containing protein [Cyanobium sp.]
MTSHRAATNSQRLPGAPTLYQLLELAPEATLQELRQAFRVLSKRYHPDTTSLPAAEAREAFSRLNQAYAVLSDPDSRRAYDAQLQRLRAAAAASATLGRSGARPQPAAGRTTSVQRPVGVRRSLSGGEWFALVLLALALLLSLVLGVGLAWARGLALVTRPSWWSEASGGLPVAAMAPPAVAPTLPQAPPERSTSGLPAPREALPAASGVSGTPSGPAAGAAAVAPREREAPQQPVMGWPDGMAPAACYNYKGFIKPCGDQKIHPLFPGCPEGHPPARSLRGPLRQDRLCPRRGSDH